MSHPLRASQATCRLFVSLVGLALLAAAPAAAAAPPHEDTVVPPGHEELFADMLGRGATLPDGCAFRAGQIERSVVRGVYACPGGEVAIELRHPSAAPPGAARTDRFGVVWARGAPADGLLAAGVARVTARERGFAWLELPPPEAHGPPKPGWVDGGMAFYALLLAGVALAALRTRREWLTRAALPVALLTLLALVLRGIASGGPADIRAVLGETRASRGGFAAFTELVYALLPPGDESIWAVDRLCGALAVPLLYALVRARFADRLIAIGAAAALAMTPLLVRFAASDTPYIPLCAAFLGALVAYDRWAERPAVATLALAFGLLTAAIELRPDGIWLVVPAALLVLARPLPAWRVLFRPSTLLCALAFVALNAVPVMTSVSGHSGGGYTASFVLVGSLFGSPWLVPAMTPGWLAALLGLGALAALGHGRAGVLWLVATLVADPIDFPADAPLGHYANARYHIPAMYLACGLIGLGSAALVRRGERWSGRPLRAAPLLAVAIIALAAAPRLDLLWHLWTPQREFAFFRAGLRQLDADCTVVALTDTRDAGFVPFDYLVPGRLLDLTPFLADGHDGCVVYYRGANCYSGALDLAPPEREIHPACREMERRFQLEPIVEAQLPADPYRDERYVRDPLPVGFYRLHPPPR
ncbi:MAG: glycosyltransferase family 39 protein [Deltaproteobacteria bacterium]|nr:glycosyltransferase family 39 protein [Deltaproteobacteria bacterium]